MNLLLVPSLLVDMNSVMNSPVCWQDDDKFAIGNVDFFKLFLPLCTSVVIPRLLSRWLQMMTCYGIKVTLSVLLL